ncbi:hypothetical protein [Pedobacter heparinus]|uniref:hypothetical protein n=1 Tax=Pedobacter heparinus TaxID=984 RepID=UPI0029309FA1|nr:hypothetical protein [Pedobacter heparinus]
MKQYAVLEYVVDVLQKAIIGSKVKQIRPDESAIIDGNASITIQQHFESNGSTAAILIRDEREILYSEELLETIYKIQEGANYHAGLKAALSITNFVINGLNIEAELIFHAIRDYFYSLSGSYEFLNFAERDIQQMKFNMNFGDDVTFDLIVLNEPDSIAIEAVIEKSVAPAVKAAINADVEKVRREINKQFKKDEVLEKVMDFKVKDQ